MTPEQGIQERKVLWTTGLSTHKITRRTHRITSILMWETTTMMRRQTSSRTTASNSICSTWTQTMVINQTSWALEQERVTLLSQISVVVLRIPKSTNKWASRSKVTLARARSLSSRKIGRRTSKKSKCTTGPRSIRETVLKWSKSSRLQSRTSTKTTKCLRSWIALILMALLHCIWHRVRGTHLSLRSWSNSGLKLTHEQTISVLLYILLASEEIWVWFRLWFSTVRT